MDSQLISIQEAAKALGLKVSTLYNWVCDRKIDFVRVGRLVKFEPETLERFIRDNRVPSMKSVGSEQPDTVTCETRKQHD